MPTFPTTEVNVVQLANNVVSGLTVYPLDFPGVDAIGLSAALGESLAAQTSCQTARAEAKAATVAKDDALTALRESLKKALNQATLDNPTKLDELGWSLPNPRTPTLAPDMCDNLTALSQGAGDVSLEWDKPKSGGKVVAYILQSQTLVDGNWSNWQMINFFYENQATVTEQPLAVQINYRVIASNDSGQSNPSNTITVVL